MSDKEKIPAEVLFLKYYQMGKSRSLRKLAKETGESFDRIKHLSQRQEWAKKIKELNKDIKAAEEQKQDIAQYAEVLLFSVAKGITDDENAKPADKLKAVEMLAKVATKSSEMKRRKQITIVFKDIDKLKEVVNKINRRREAEAKYVDETIG